MKLSASVCDKKNNTVPGTDWELGDLVQKFPVPALIEGGTGTELIVFQVQDDAVFWPDRPFHSVRRNTSKRLKNMAPDPNKVDVAAKFHRGKDLSQADCHGFVTKTAKNRQVLRLSDAAGTSTEPPIDTRVKATRLGPPLAGGKPSVKPRPQRGEAADFGATLRSGRSTG